ncbi:copper resistance D family protein [Pseudalkalibacillus sp. Hm43]|uniref:copper resistance D family protein n=1 Tax=Pseudalkalibacillus sp. Hm43 TaxID=3450742 RepID=UPI003F442D1F
MIIFFKGVLYLVFSLLFGGLLLASVPENKKPKVKVPKELLLWLIVLVPIIMFISLLQIIGFLSESVGYWDTFTAVLFEFNIGKAWLASIMISVVLLLLVYKNDLQSTTFYARLGAFLTVILMSSYSFASHSASLYPVIGFIAHFIHVLAVTGWVGVLLYVAWSSKEDSNWIPFLNWYTPFSIGAVLLLTGGGLLINEIVAPQYVDSWALNYGQALLIKHLLLIPLFLYAVLHGVYLKKAIQTKGNRYVLRSLRGETILILFVFGVTAFLSQQVPPHEVWRTILQEDPSPLFMSQFNGTIDSQTVLTFEWTMKVFLWGLGAIVVFALTAITIVRRWPILISVPLAVLGSGLAYVALITGVL